MVVILPWQPITKPSEGDVGNWTKELYLRPGEWIPVVGLVLSVAIALLGGVVLLLHLAEKVSSLVEEETRTDFEFVAERGRDREES